MGATRAICDTCGIETDYFVTDYDNTYRCRKCDLLHQLQCARDAYVDKKEWLESTHLKTLADLKKRLDEAETAVKGLLPNSEPCEKR